MTEKTSKKAYKGSGANPIKDTIETIPNYPKKLVIFKVESSPYYWSRVYVNGRYSVRSLKTDNRKLAQQAAIKFFTDILVDHRVGIAKPLKSRTFTNVGNDYLETINDGGKTRRYADDKNRFNNGLVPFFAETDIGEVTNARISDLIKNLSERGIAPATVNHYLIVLRKILKYANDNRLIDSVPNFPKVNGKTTALTKRDFFDLKEMGKLTRTVEKMAKEGVKVRGVAITLELKYLIQFMVNSFIRPSDLRVLKHSHVTVKPIPDATNPAYANFLILSHPATKTTDQDVVTMPAAYRNYVAIKDEQQRRGYGKKTDYVFMPEYPNRNTMMNVLGRLFREAVKQAGISNENEIHTLYSLRHSSIMFRLMLGEGINTLQLAKNARTSQAMIEKFYASRLTNLMNVTELHSFKAKAKSKKKTENVDEATGAADIGYVDGSESAVEVKPNKPAAETPTKRPVAKSKAKATPRNPSKAPRGSDQS
jgi:integrase